MIDKKPIVDEPRMSNCPVCLILHHPTGQFPPIPIPYATVPERSGAVDHVLSFLLLLDLDTADRGSGVEGGRAFAVRLWRVTGAASPLAPLPPSTPPLALALGRGQPTGAYVSTVPM